MAEFTTSGLESNKTEFANESSTCTATDKVSTDGALTKAVRMVLSLEEMGKNQRTTMCAASI